MPDLDLKELRECLDRGEIIDEIRVTAVLDALMEILLHEDNVVRVSSPVIICGDIHGQFEDLQKLFRTAVDFSDSHSVKDHNWIFMGDYVDRGRFSFNTFLLLATHKLEHPDGFFLLRGNHESRSVTQMYGFQKEIVASYSDGHLWTKCMEVFDLLPIAAVTDENVFSVHGGLSPYLGSVSDLLAINRRKEIPAEGLLADITWSDPEDKADVWRENVDRGAGMYFGEKQTEQFCHLNRMKLVTRSHQIVQVGVQWYYKSRQGPGLLIDVWSAPNYGGKSGNIASVLRLRFTGRDEFDLPTFTQEQQTIKEPNVVADLPRYFA